MMTSTFLITVNAFLGLGIGTMALPQASFIGTSTTPARQLPSSTPSSTAGVVPSLAESVLSSLPIIPVEGDNSVAIVQATNASLLETHPEIDVEPSNDLPQFPSNLTRRDQCIGGPFSFPITPWTNVKLLTDRVCDFWFPNNQVFYVPAPLPSPGYVLVKIPFGPSLPTLSLKYQTVNPSPVTDLFTPLTSTICKKRFDSILAFATSPGNFQCPAPPNVHAGNDCDVTSRAACFSFELN
ncbi:uncharacterized protein N7482_003276 [Penicillium canariense]|uniref:Uncharacterized protein n=1 Tax=Penicillium canariense TaxID=189055 RepID=A0A9W9LNH7_9EURO|nr:uncharacterized protein N7482_003276 [Penicillium canariense]KAJ5167682.1 hypothetical protein N7482_003276 [Penicillium canariense]